MSLISPPSSKNALFVLRLLWKGHNNNNARQLSTAALAREPTADGESSSPSTIDMDIDRRNASPASTTITARDPQITAFLEDESPEYTTATLTLPPLSFHPSPIPWPTLFPHHHHRQPLTPHTPPKICDPLYRLVALRQYPDAQKVYVELLSHKIRIQHRHEYLSAAIRSFDQGQFRNFLLWLEIYPNRPATTNHPGLKTIWTPVIDRILKKKKNDYDFIEQFLMVISKKGLLPTILPPLIPHLTFNLPPTRSEAIIEQSLLAYSQSTTSTESTSRNALVAQSIVNDQIAKTWKSYLLKLIVAGWKEQALPLYERPPANVTWDEFTHRICSEELYHNDDQSTSLSTSPSGTLTLASQLRAALYDLPTPSHLASLLRILSSDNMTHDYPTLLNRFKGRFCNPPKTAKNRSSPTIMSRLWIHAEIINLQHEGSHEDALRHFERTFHWAGLPSHPSQRSDVEQNPPRSFPNIQLITTLLPSLLLLLPSPHSESVPAFYAAYLDNIYGTEAKTIPSLRPTYATHNIFLRAIAHHSGPDTALRMLRRANETSSSASSTTEESGPAVGEAGYAAVLLSFAGRRRLVEMYDLLSEAEETLSHGNGRGVGRRTYKGLVAVLVKTGKGEDAEKIYMRAVEKLGVEAEDLVDDLVVT